ncbi:hypothetical protein [Nioella aestuarii]|uniref:hypothetical protein n=1 Tax=Nioella aestuarii TaxID=1662864 RepID=UPI003D7FB668
MRRHAGNTGELRSEATVFRAQAQGDRFAARVLTELSDLDDIFANPTSTASTIEGVFSDIMPDARYIGEMQTPEETAEAGADERHLLRTPGGNDFVVYQDEDRVWIDVHLLKEGEGGNRVHSAISGYAINTGRTFIGDPAGLSPEALSRRTENMLSSALKHGTTEHLEPHEYQTRGDESLGVPPLRWKSGDHLGSIQRMIDVLTESVAHYVPEIRRARYDFQTGTFRTSQGERLSDEMLDGWASRFERMREAGIGSRTALLHKSVERLILRIQLGSCFSRPTLPDLQDQEPAGLQ